MTYQLVFCFDKSVDSVESVESINTSEIIQMYTDDLMIGIMTFLHNHNIDDSIDSGKLFRPFQNQHLNILILSMTPKNDYPIIKTATNGTPTQSRVPPPPSPPSYRYTLETFRWTLRINNDIVNLESDVWYNPAILHKLNGDGYPNTEYMNIYLWDKLRNKFLISPDGIKCSSIPVVTWIRKKRTKPVRINL